MSSALFAILKIFLIGGGVALFVFLICCAIYRNVLRCGKQKLFTGYIRSGDGNQERNADIDQPVVIEHSPPSLENDQNSALKGYNVRQPQHNPMQQFPPEYSSMQHITPQSQLMQQYSPQHSPMQHITPQSQQMQHYSPQHSPMPHITPQSQKMQQYSSQHYPMQHIPPENQPMPQHPSLQQFQPSTSASQAQFCPPPGIFFNFPEPPPPYENEIPCKY